jgi:hypothetical protein
MRVAKARAGRRSGRPDLGGRFVLLSASFPSGERGEAFRPYDPGSISDAIVAIARGVLTAGGSLVFGGHPTVTPLVLLIAGEAGVTRRVVAYQSRLFEHQITPETRALEHSGVGEIRWVEAPGRGQTGRLDASLADLRRRMLVETEPVAGFFVGGMEGIVDEWTLASELQPLMLRMPLGRPGGAAARLLQQANVPSPLARSLMTSDHYPAVVRNALLLLSGDG